MEDKFKISRLRENDLLLFIKLVELLNEVFEEYYTVASKERLKKLLSKSEFYAIVIVKNDAIVGGLTAYELQRYYNDKSELYIYDMAVKTELHNQGLGKALINYLKDYGALKGIQTIFVEAHSEDIQAVKFYESTFGKSEKVDHFNFELKVTNRNKYNYPPGF